MEQEYLDPFLIERIRDGENQAFKIVMDHLHDRLAVMAYQMLFHPENVKDAVAHGFAKLYEHRKEMESIRHVEGFLHITVQNICLDNLRKVRRRKSLWDLRPEWAHRNEKASPETEADQPILMADLMSCIQATLDKMPANWRMAYKLYVLNDMTAKEAGEIMGISDQTVREHVRRVMGEIYQELVRKGLYTPLILWLLTMGLSF